jgi:hypothetical protein
MISTHHLTSGWVEISTGMHWFYCTATEHYANATCEEHHMYVVKLFGKQMCSNMQQRIACTILYSCKLLFFLISIGNKHWYNFHYPIHSMYGRFTNMAQL